ncbi:hypothetical protein ACL03H_01855 [Saccharopolyspora sp. MS10]|uniref:hypothetical protein n=1 Tax=Saccharopolyspora sp. MS10 TaxID=3385973 RepID=UPI0039A30CE9
MSSDVLVEVDDFGILEPPPLAVDPEVEPRDPGIQPRYPGGPTVGGNITAGAGVDQSRGKIMFTNSIVATGEELAENLARAFRENRGVRGVQDPEALAVLASRYVAPAGLLEADGSGDPSAFDVLSERRLLVLSAPGHDCGQLSAALRLGHRLRDDEPELVVREELWEDPASLQADRLLDEHEPAVVVLDLRGVAADDLRSVARELAGLNARLDDYESYLVVIVPSMWCREFEARVPGRTRVLRQPPVDEVFQRYFRREEAINREFLSRLEAMWPPQIAAIATAAREALERGEELPAALDLALQQEPEERLDRLRAAVRTKQDERDAEWVAMLLAVAALEGAPARHIVRAADELSKASGGSVAPQEESALLRPSPLSRLRILAPERDDPWIDLTTGLFAHRGYGSMVLQYFVREHDDLRDALKAWLGRLPNELKDLEREELERLADRTADLAVSGDLQLALQVARKWAQTGTGTASGGHRTSMAREDQYRRSVAVRLLTTIATNPSGGSEIRKRLWEWSRGNDADLLLLTAEVCAGLGLLFPRNALTRLKHLANSAEPSVRAAVIRGLRQIGQAHGLPHLLRALEGWFDEAGPQRIGVIVEAVSVVIEDPRQGSDTDEAIASFWRRALAVVGPNELRPLVEQWLRTASLQESDERDAKVESLVEAAKHDARLIASLEWASRFGPLQPDLSQFGSDPVASVIAQLWTRLDEVNPIAVEE